MKIKDKYYENIEGLLYNYNMLKINIEIADKQLEELKNEDGMTAISYDGIQTSATNKISSMTEIVAERNIAKEELIIKRKEKLLEKLNKLDRLLEELKETEQKIVSMYYIEGWQWWQIAYEVKYSERHCKRIRTEAIRKLAVGLYGEKVLEKEVM
ncbi:sigma factor-like helix-turn-helix DNA-binding protein [Proteiniborus sp. MB09-C3]|uniref:sigma factor-like helix-turn-helix DNA-binding protein n=1 Tax=Proteiniborus sp. MB09-C3 TaxID=3050072 RepID=UPI0025570FF0|nr:sigma factor-like helix-turn-helix DNA-binding protein [Proteiniborus sp. MB09-C3]WIV11380.1 sigma factor-like helix-turn-helix DNA-binding protein [Proteiniborus sp. MB09-C3]